MVYSDGYLYVADFYGELHRISSNGVFLSVFVGDRLNGLCQDPSNPEMLYCTAIGLDFISTFAYNDADAGIYAINTTDMSSQRLYSGATSPFTDGNETYVLYPNGCTVKDGVVYFVETRSFDGTGALGMYTIATGEFSLD